jgi:hypothetical protein
MTIYYSSQPLSLIGNRDMQSSHDLLLYFFYFAPQTLGDGFAPNGESTVLSRFRANVSETEKVKRLGFYPDAIPNRTLPTVPVDLSGAVRPLPGIDIL